MMRLARAGCETVRHRRSRADYRQKNQDCQQVVLHLFLNCLRVLRVSVVNFRSKKIHHGDTEDTEISYRTKNLNTCAPL